MAQFALRWILMFDAVTLRDSGRQAAIAGAGELRGERSAGAIPEAAMAAIRGIYDAKIREMVHQRW